jgi:disulfide bond formation protein DsbB
MNTYLILSLMLAGGMVVFLVNLIKSKINSELALFGVIAFISVIIGLFVTVSLWHFANIFSLGGSSTAIYFFSQVIYQVGKVVSKWLTQKGPVTPDEVEKDTEGVVSDIEKDVAQVENAPTA